MKLKPFHFFSNLYLFFFQLNLRKKCCLSNIHMARFSQNAVEEDNYRPQFSNISFKLDTSDLAILCA